jgi:hypothetical protein
MAFAIALAEASLGDKPGLGRSVCSEGFPSGAIDGPTAATFNVPATAFMFRLRWGLGVVSGCTVWSGGGGELSSYLCFLCSGMCTLSGNPPMLDILGPWHGGPPYYRRCTVVCSHRCQPFCAALPMGTLSCEHPRGDPCHICGSVLSQVGGGML